VDNVPPEEHLMARRRIKLDDRTPFNAHRKRMIVSDLIALGVPAEIAYDLPSEDSAEYNMERQERLEDEDSFPVNNVAFGDEATRVVWVTECYILMDEDGDGYAELRKVLVAGEGSLTILEDRMVNHQPMVSLTPTPMPHKFHGRSVADQLHDLQMIMSTILRQLLDNMYIVNNGRWEVVEGAVMVDDLLESRPGGVVRVQASGSVKALETPQLGNGAMGILEYLESVRQMRTGAGGQSQGLDASLFRNQTATGVSQFMSAASGKKECIARVFAETGVRDLFKKILQEVIENPPQNAMVEIGDSFQPINPSDWSSNMTVEVEVGLGLGAEGERVQNLIKSLEVDGQVAQNGRGWLMTPQNTYRKLVELARAMGLPTPKQYYTDPVDKQDPEPSPDPDVELQVQAKMSETQRRKADDEAQNLIKSTEVDLKRDEKMDLSTFRYVELHQKREMELKRLETLTENAKIQADAQIAISKQNRLNNGGPSNG
jgi:hypothetical protein